MSKFLSLTVNEIIKALQKIGFADGGRTVIPIHSGENIGTELLSLILRDRQLTKDEFKNLL